jgi:hypothetical protein
MDTHKRNNTQTRGLKLTQRCRASTNSTTSGPDEDPASFEAWLDAQPTFDDEAVCFCDFWLCLCELLNANAQAQEPFSQGPECILWLSVDSEPRELQH